MQKLGIGTVKTVEKTVDVSMDGVKLGADVTTGAVRDATRMILPKTDAKDKGTISETVNEKNDEITIIIGQNDNVQLPVEDQSSDSKIQTRVSSQNLQCR